MAEIGRAAALTGFSTFSLSSPSIPRYTRAMKTFRPPFSIVAVFAFFAALSAMAQTFLVDWAYHAAEGADPSILSVPGLSTGFLDAPAAASSPVSVFVLTDHDFAGDWKEQVGVRWWDGRMAHWITGNWIKNVTRDDLSGTADWASALPGGTVFDLWRVEIPAWIPQPGDNYYAIQLKAVGPAETVERYLVARGGGDFSRTNALGQVWSASEEFDGQDWRVTIPGGTR